MAWCVVLLVSALALASALPTDQVIRKLDETRYQYVRGPDGTPHLVDLWLKTSDLKEIARFDPDRQNVYHLFTRLNPTVSQPMLVGNHGLLGLTNYNPLRRTIVLLHGWMVNVSADLNTALVPAFLSAEDVNVIVVDWSAGAGTINYVTAVANTVTSGEGVARFIAWLNEATGAVPNMYHIVGHSLGAHKAGIIGRNLGGQIAYITALEAALPGWISNDDKFRSTDGVYTEVIHTNAGLLGFITTLGDADFYPNGGINMPGCDSQECDHARSYFYLAETLISGGFTGRRCASYATAMAGQCYLWGSLNMGGLVPKTGSSGIFHLETNAAPPFSQALPTDQVVQKLDETRYQYVRGPDGTPHLVDLWLKTSDLKEIARFDPDTQNVYHLYTRLNPTVSQPMLVGTDGLLGLTNYNPLLRTIVLLHGWLDNVSSDMNTLLVPAFLSTEDVNVIVVDWSAGAGTINYVAAVANTVTSGESVARFIAWLNEVTGAVPDMYHIVGHSLGGHQAGIIGRNLGGLIAYITALDAALPGWLSNDNKFRSTDGVYTEVIHTNAGLLGYIGPLGDVDFYPNAGINMPGCITQECDHASSYFYMAETLTSGGFTGTRCASYVTAMAGQCYLWGSLNMGGLVPKTGSSGIFYLETNAAPPFSQG